MELGKTPWMKASAFFGLLLLLSLFSFACNPILITPKTGSVFGTSPTPTFTFTPGFTYVPPPLTPTPYGTPCPGAAEFGSTGGGGYVYPSVMILSRYQASGGFTVESLSLDASTSVGKQFQLGLYADNGSGTGPTTALGLTGAQVIYTNGANTAVVLPSVVLTAGSYYWLGCLTNGSVALGGTSVNVTDSVDSSLPVSFIPSHLTSGGSQLHVFANTCPDLPTLTPTITSTPTPVPPLKRMFVTSLGYAPNWGGLPGGDSICSARAAAAALGGTWVAYLSTSSTNAISRLPFATWVTTNGVTIFDSTNDLAAGSSPLAPPDIDEFGQPMTVNPVWTGSNAYGIWAGNDCSGWTTTGTSYVGTVGQDDLAAYWSSGGAYNNCGLFNNCIYCFEQ